MSELRDLYQEMILDHCKRPRNFGLLEAANRRANGHNPLCGDKVTIALVIENGRVIDARFQGVGCAISIAAASLMIEAIKGKTEQDVREIFRKFHTGLTTADDAAGAATLADLDKLAVFGGVREYPVRVKCATLPWHTLIAALDRSEQPAKTE